MLELSLTFSFIMESWLILSPLASAHHLLQLNWLVANHITFEHGRRNSSVFLGLAAAEKRR